MDPLWEFHTADGGPCQSGGVETRPPLSILLVGMRGILRERQVRRAAGRSVATGVAIPLPRTCSAIGHVPWLEWRCV